MLLLRVSVFTKHFYSIRRVPDESVVIVTNRNRILQSHVCRWQVLHRRIVGWRTLTRCVCLLNDLGVVQSHVCRWQVLHRPVCLLNDLVVQVVGRSLLLNEFWHSVAVVLGDVPLVDLVDGLIDRVCIIELSTQHGDLEPDDLLQVSEVPFLIVWNQRRVQGIRNSSEHNLQLGNA